MIIDGSELIMPMPDKNNTAYREANPGMDLARAERRAGRLPPQDRPRAEAAGHRRGACAWVPGRLEWVHWPDVQTSFVDYGYWTRRVSEFETEKQLRSAQAFGSLFFVILGAPVGILFAKRDFLSAFISCFVPIIIVVLPVNAARA